MFVIIITHTVESQYNGTFNSLSQISQLAGRWLDWISGYRGQ